MRYTPEEQLTFEEGYRNIFESTSDGLLVYDLKKGAIIEANPAACLMHGYTRQEFIGSSPAVFMVTESHKAFMEYVRAAEPESAFDTLLIHVRKDGSTFHAEERISAIDWQGQACLLNVIRDVNQRIQEEKAQSAQIQARMNEQAALLSISHILASTLEIQPQLILDQLRLIVEYNQAGFFSLENPDLVSLAIRGLEPLEGGELLRIHLNAPEHLVALFNKHRPIRIADVWEDTPQAIFLRQLLTDETTVLLKGMKSWMWIPLAVKGRIIGGIGMAHEKKGYFTPYHADLALSVANQVAITMINAGLYKQAQTFAVLEERQRLARNLHDAINQSLFSVGLIAEVLPRLWEKDQQEARHSLQDLRRLTRGAQAEMRALLAELRPSTLIDSNLGDLLNLLGNAHSGRTNIPVNVTVTGEFTLPSEVQVTFYRVCQEALYNVAKHTKANKVEINLMLEDGVIELRVRDNGEGFDLKQNFSGHYGLSIMRERAEAIGAVLTIHSKVGSGTELTMRWTQSPTESL